MTTQAPTALLYRVRVGVDLSDDSGWICRIQPYRATLLKKAYRLSNGDMVKVSELMVVKSATIDTQPSQYTYCEEHQLEAAKALLAEAYRQHVLSWQQRFTVMVEATNSEWALDIRKLHDE